MLVLKASAVGVALVCRSMLPKRYTQIVPAGLALPWLAAVFINLYVISLAI